MFISSQNMKAARPVPRAMTNAIKAARARAAEPEGLMRAEKQAGGESARWGGPIRVAGSGHAYGDLDGRALGVGEAGVPQGEAAAGGHRGDTRRAAHDPGHRLIPGDR